MHFKSLLKHSINWRYIYLTTLIALFTYFGVNAFENYQPTVSSDKADYAPGEIATITGYGWTQDSMVHVEFKEEPDYPDYHVYDVVVDENGKWEIKYQIEERHLGVKFSVTAVGQQSGVKATTVFTDALQIRTSISVASGEATTGTSATYLVTVKNTNTQNTTGTLGSLTVLLPAGYNYVSVGSINAGTGNTWIFDPYNSLNRLISLKASDNASTLANLEELSFTVSVQNPTSVGNYTWTTTGYGNRSYNGGTYTIETPPGQPVISITKACVAPAVTAQPANKTITYGSGEQSFSVSASGDVSAYQWQYSSDNGGNWSNINGATSETYSIANPTVSISGNQYRAIVYGCNGSVASNAATLTVNKANATITLANLGHTYDGTGKAASVSTDAVGNSSFTITYDGAAQLPVNYKTGGYSVIATLVNVNYSGSATGTLHINKADQVISWETPEAITYGTALSDRQLTATALGGAALTYLPDNGTLLNAGSHTLKVTAAETNNYKAGSKEVSITVNKASVVLTLGNLSHTYNGTLKSATASAEPSVSGVLVTGSGTNAGEYAASASLDNPNYEAVPVQGMLVIGKATLSIKADNATKVYGDAVPVLSGSVVSGGVQGENFVVTASAEATSSSSVGDYAIIPSVSGSTLANYDVSATNGKLTITPKAITVTPVAGQTKVYGTADPVLTYANTDLVGSDSFTGVLAREAGNSVGAYNINQGSLALNSNYTLNFEEGVKFNITPKSVTASITAADKVYDGTTTASASGTALLLEDGDDVNVVVSNANFNSKHVGSGKTVTAGVALSGTDAGNYSLANTTAFATAAITHKDITGSFTADSKVYDGTSAASITGTQLAGVVANDEVSLTGGSATFADKNAGTGKTVTLSGSALVGADKDNYRLTAVSTAFADIYQKPASVSPIANSKVYGASDPALTGNTSGFLAADGITANYSRVAGETVADGPYTIYATLSPAEALANYDITYNTANFTINKATLTATADDKSRKYGEENPPLTVSYSGFVNNETASVLTQAPVPATAATRSSGVGNYPISVAGGQAANYSFTYTNGTLTINKADIAVVAANKSKTYGDANPLFSGTITGIKNNDNITASYSTTATVTSPVGDYDIVPSLSGDLLANYNTPVTTNGKLTITPKVVTASLVAANKVYDGSTTATATGSLPANDLVGNDVVTVLVSDAAFADKNVGTWNVIAGVALSGTDAVNYSLSSTNAQTKADITPRPVTVTAAAKSKIYGDDDPEWNYQITAGQLVEGDAFTGNLNRATGENVGNYAILLNTLSPGNNYAITYAGANLTITKAPLTVKADNGYRLCGQANYAYTGVITGIKRNDAITATYTTTADQTSGAGTYTIAPLPAGAALDNYEVTIVNGTLTIGGVVTDATANSTPQAVKNTATTVIIKVTTLSGSPAANVPVKLYFDGNASASETMTNSNGEANFNVGTLQTGVYKILAVAGTGCSEMTVYLPVYDPNGGFVTGGGWIESPAGAYKANTTLTGKAHFGFVAKYKKGSTIPDGNTEFQFQAGNLIFNSTSYDDMRLVIGGSKANYKGRGKINGAGDYGFMVTAIDGQITGGGGVDKFRIKIWAGNDETAVVYDNQMGAGDDALPTTALGGGSIVIHEVKTTTKTTTTTSRVIASAQPEAVQFYNYPNTFTDKTTIAFSVNKAESYTLEVYDMRGALITTVKKGIAEAGKLYEYEFNGNSLSKGIYVARLVTPSSARSIKMLLTK